MSAQPQLVTNINPEQPKAKRKYTKRKPSITSVKPKARKTLPKTARAYLNTLGMKADKEGVAVTELIKLHSEMIKLRDKKEYEVLALMTSPDPITPVDPKSASLWQRWFGK
jgi:hypothetical protein